MPTPTPPRVLMVEDHRDVAELYQLKLQLEGYRVAVAQDGPTGLELARSLRPDVILLDVHLPILDGLQVLAALRESEDTRQVPVVVFSEDDSFETMQKAKGLNVSAYLVKANLLPSTLARVVSSALHDRPHDREGRATA
ncbi:MAG TPA: response regulator [Candidatus Limnocylindrales bacterium]|nr:response regulator [Candidatus Limnocylindrales bacterium]